jgi:hypothetical protein
MSDFKIISNYHVTFTAKGNLLMHGELAVPLPVITHNLAVNTAVTQLNKAIYMWAYFPKVAFFISGQNFCNSDAG